MCCHAGFPRGSLHPLTYVSAVWTEYDAVEVGRNEEVYRVLGKGTEVE